MPKEMIKAPLEKAPKNALDSFPFLKRHTHFPYKKITNYSFIFFFSFLLLHHSQVAFFCFIPFPSFACLLLVSSVSLCIYPPYQPHHHHIPSPSFPSSLYSPTNHPYPDQEHRKGSPSLEPPNGSRAAVLLAAHAAEPLLHGTNLNYPQRKIL